jgi:hypothetical protein
MLSHYNRIVGQSVERLAALGDGVFAPRIGIGIGIGIGL